MEATLHVNDYKFHKPGLYISGGNVNSAYVLNEWALTVREIIA